MDSRDLLAWAAWAMNDTTFVIMAPLIPSVSAASYVTFSLSKKCQSGNQRRRPAVTTIRIARHQSSYDPRNRCHLAFRDDQSPIVLNSHHASHRATEPMGT